MKDPIFGGKIIDEKEFKEGLLNWIPDRGIIPPNFVEKFWQSLKEECCVNPSTAFRCVIVEEKDVENAFKKMYNS